MIHSVVIREKPPSKRPLIRRSLNSKQCMKGSSKFIIVSALHLLIEITDFVVRLFL